MEKCLVTTLKAVVNNNNLPFFNGFVFNLHSAEEGDLYSLSLVNKEFYVKILEGNGYLWTKNSVNLGRECTTTSAFRYQSPTGDIAKILVKPKYDVEQLSSDYNITAEINLEGVKYMNLTRFGSQSFIAKGNLDNFLASTNLKYARFNGVDCTGDISVFKDKANLVTLQISGFGSVVNITGDITVLSSLVNATTINLAHMPNITGSYETLLEGMYKNGRRSGTMTNYFGPKCMFNNSAINGANNYQATFSESGVSVSKNSVVVATYNGTAWSYV